MGLRFNECDGEHYRLSQIEQILMQFSMLLSASSDAEMDLVNAIQAINEHFTKWSLSDFHWCLESQQAYQQIQSEIDKWNLLMKDELRIRAV